MCAHCAQQVWVHGQYMPHAQTSSTHLQVQRLEQHVGDEELHIVHASQEGLAALAQSLGLVRAPLGPCSPLPPAEQLTPGLCHLVAGEVCKQGQLVLAVLLILQATVR